MAAAEREDRRGHGRRVTPSNPPEDPYNGYVLGWRIDSPTTTKRRRNRMHHPDGRSIHTSELQGRHQDRSSRDRTPREEPRLPVSSPEPTQSATSEELRFRQPLSRPLSSLGPTQPFSSEELRRLAPGLDHTRPFSREVTEEPRQPTSSEEL
jgi:hypothetical protein